MQTGDFRGGRSADGAAHGQGLATEVSWRTLAIAPGVLEGFAGFPLWHPSQ